MYMYTHTRPHIHIRTYAETGTTHANEKAGAQATTAANAVTGLKLARTSGTN